MSTYCRHGVARKSNLSSIHRHLTRIFIGSFGIVDARPELEDSQQWIMRTAFGVATPSKQWRLLSIIILTAHYGGGMQGWGNLTCTPRTRCRDACAAIWHDSGEYRIAKNSSRPTLCRRSSIRILAIFLRTAQLLFRGLSMPAESSNGPARRYRDSWEGQGYRWVPVSHWATALPRVRPQTPYIFEIDT